MSVRTERPYVRTAQDLERKYASILNSGNAIKQTETGLVKVNNILNDFLAATIGDLETLKGQLDGQIATWYGDDEPTLSNKPTSDWEVSDYSEHIDDIYYDRSTGYTYQFIEDNGTYSWEKIDSSLMSEIFGLANAARDTADGKRRVFVTTEENTTPSPPYDEGDLWVKNIGSSTGEMYICQIAKNKEEVYQSGDFIIATKYTDDTIALEAKDAVQRVEDFSVEVDKKAAALKFNFENRIILADGTEDSDGKVLSDNYATITFDDGAIILSASNSIIQMKIDNDSIEFINTKTNKVLGSWSANTQTAVSTELYLGHFAFQPRDNGSLGFRKVN